MLYLAKVCRQGEAGEVSLRLLARQKSEHFWMLSSGDNSIIAAPQADTYNDDTLVLVNLTSGRQIVDIQDATEWVLGLVDKYLTTGITPETLHKEAERVEEWRKDLTLKNQEIARRALELETRRDQIQELEKKLENERKQLESSLAHLNPDGEETNPDQAQPQHSEPSEESDEMSQSATS